MLEEPFLSVSLLKELAEGRGGALNAREDYAPLPCGWSLRLPEQAHLLATSYPRF